MMKTRHHPAVLAILLTGLLATPALAEPPGKGMHPGMGTHSGMGMGSGMGMSGGMGGGEHGRDSHGFGPHNAAAHFLKMADTIGLDAAQTDQLRTLRDAWIDANAATEDRLKAAEADLKGLLFADRIDMKAVDAKLAAIGRMEGPLWRAFAQQLHDIKELLSDDQRARLRTRMRHHPM